MNLNLSASLNVTKLLFKPGLCLPHHTVPTFDDLPIPFGKGLCRDAKPVDIRAVVLDKDDCFAVPDTNVVHPPYEARLEELKKAYPGRRLLVVSNTAGSSSWDRGMKQAVAVEQSTGLHVLRHAVKKPGCGVEILDYFKRHADTEVTHPSQIAVVGDRLTTDMMLANTMGSWGIWIKEGVVPLEKKSPFAKLERRLAAFLLARGFYPPDPTSPFD